MKKTNIMFIIAVALCCPTIIPSAADLGSDALDLLGATGGISTGGGVLGDITTGDITIGDILNNFLNSLFNLVISPCNQNITSTCSGGAVCDVKVGSCSVSKQEKKLNAAPTNLVFSRYLSTNKHRRESVSFAKTSTTSVQVPLKLTKENNFTSLIQVVGGNAYLFIALPTEPALVDGIKGLPVGLARYLKSQDGRGYDAVIKIYTSTDNLATWSELADQTINTPYANLKMSFVLGNSVEVMKSGDLVVSYKNIKGEDGKVIPLLRVTYSAPNVMQ